MANKPNYPQLDTPIYEEQEVERPELSRDPITGTVTRKMVKGKVQVKTIYSKKSHYADICANFDHNWIVKDRHIYVATCTKCPMRRYLDPTKHTVVEGRIIDRKTKMPL